MIKEYEVVCEQVHGYDQTVKIGGTNDAAHFLQNVLKLGRYDRERFVTLYVNAPGFVVGYETTAIGQLNKTYVKPADIFRGAILNNAYAVIIAHNHPSGSCSPSGSDSQLTQRIKQAGELLGVKLLDHIIVGQGCYYSFAEERLL